MEFGHYQIQIFASVALILGAALIALICDYLKGDNQRLRELTVELTARHEESERLIHLISFPLQRTGAATQPPVTTAEETFSSPFSQATEPEHERDLSRAEAPAVWEEEFSLRAQANLAEHRRISPETMVAMLRRAIQMRIRGRVVAANSEAPAGFFESAMPMAPSGELLQPVVDAVSVRNAAEQDQGPAGGKKVAARKDWNALLAVSRASLAQPRKATGQAPVPEASGLLDAVVAATAEPGGLEPAWPSGMQSALVLDRLIDSGRRVSGLVVAIAVTSSSPAEALAESAAAVRSGIESLLEAGDFAAPTGTDAFVVICPGTRGASAQRRLGRISQHLWDVQLASLGQIELQYTWGGLEVCGESIKDAREAAEERLQETRHSRDLAAHVARPAPSLALRASV